MGKNVKTIEFSSVAATFEKAITYVFAGRLIRNAEVRGSTPLCSTICFQRLTASAVAWLFWPTGQYLDIFSGAELDRLNPLGILNGSHVTHRHANILMPEKLKYREGITTSFGQASAKGSP